MKTLESGKSFIISDAIRPSGDPAARQHLVDEALSVACRRWKCGKPEAFPVDETTCIGRFDYELDAFAALLRLGNIGKISHGWAAIGCQDGSEVEEAKANLQQARSAFEAARDRFFTAIACHEETPVRLSAAEKLLQQAMMDAQKAFFKADAAFKPRKLIAGTVAILQPAL